MFYVLPFIATNIKNLRTSLSILFVSYEIQTIEKGYNVKFNFINVCVFVYIKLINIFIKNDFIFLYTK